MWWTCSSKSQQKSTNAFKVDSQKELKLLLQNSY